jgi:hypothetical protein
MNTAAGCTHSPDWHAGQARCLLSDGYTHGSWQLGQVQGAQEVQVPHLVHHCP